MRSECSVGALTGGIDDGSRECRAVSKLENADFQVGKRSFPAWEAISFSLEKNLSKLENLEQRYVAGEVKQMGR
jgi:hypothetical protein